jgi:HSP20 family protein
MLATLFYHPDSLQNHIPDNMSLRCNASPKRLIYQMGTSNRECQRINGSKYDHIRTSGQSSFFIKNDDGRIELSLNVPGIKVDALTVELENGVMTVSGQRTIGIGSDSPKSKRRRVFHRFEVNDTVDPENVTANLLNGVLAISLPNREPSKPRQIKIIEGCDDIQEGNGEINQNDIRYDTHDSSDDDLVIVETVENKEEVMHESDGAM